MQKKTFNNPTKQDEDQLRRNDPDLTKESLATTDSFVPDENHPSQQLSDTMKTAMTTSPKQNPFVFVPLQMGGGGRTHQVSEASKRLIDEEVTLEDLQHMTELFYEKAFADNTLDQFIRSHDDPHGARFAKWIHQKLSGSSEWDRDRRSRNRQPVVLAEGIRHVVHDRSSAHAAAWYSPKRPARDVGRHFTLSECRVWMRLHFWALRDSGIMETSPSFADYYVRFIGHFVRVYENSAPTYARDALRWSADPRNIEAYLQQGRQMLDVLDISEEEAIAQIPQEEAFDMEWPYNEYP